MSAPNWITWADPLEINCPIGKAKFNVAIARLHSRKYPTAFLFFLWTQPISPIEYDAIARLDGSKKMSC